MLARIVAVTKPLIAECDNAEDFIAYAARVSNPANQNTSEGADKLVRYLIKNNHWSPLEMVSATIEINTTRDIARQILRHRSFSFQEFSQRYAVATNFVTRQARLQDLKNRQNSVATEDAELEDWWHQEQVHLLDKIDGIYKEALKRGIAKEQARAVLPEGCTMSKLYMSGTLRSWVHYCQLRMANGTQLEHMEVAKACWEELGKHFPNIIKAVE